MTLIKTSLLNAVAVIIKMLTMLGLNKVLAIYVGPSGYAAIGQFQNAIQMLVTFSGGAVNTGVVKYTAEYQGDSAKQHAVWRTAGTLSLALGVVISLSVAIFSKPLSNLFLSDTSMHSVLYWLAASLLFFLFNNLFLAVLNGKKEIYKYVFANIVGSVFSVAVTSLMVVEWGIYGALVAVSIHQSLTFFATVLIVLKASWFKFSFFWGRPSCGISKKLAGFALMALTSAACIPLSHILLRSHLVNNFGWDAAGYWEAMWRLSSAYLLFITTTLSLYYLPRLSELNTYAEIKKEVINGYKIILPITAAGAFLIFLCRDLIISLLFTAEFMPMAHLFAWQLFGDVLKIGSWILAYLMLGKAMTKLFITSEIAAAVGFYLIAVTLSNFYGLTAVVMAHAITYFIYWIIMGFLIVNRLKKDESRLK